MSRRPPHAYLTDTERRHLDILVRRAARAMPANESHRLLGLFEHHVADLQHARATAGGLRREINELRQHTRPSDGPPVAR